MRVTDQVKRCVVFIGVESEASGMKRIHFGGTAFFVGVKSTRIAESAFMFLVTAKHVAQELENKEFYIRVNTKDGKAGVMKGIQGIKWWYHPTDSAADVALFPLALEPRLFDFAPLPFEMLLTEEERLKKGIGIGSEVFITGLFVHHVGTSKNLPILRTGTIAMIPEERIPIKKFGDMDAFLIEARSIGGLSGSPVFVLGPGPDGKAVMHLMGLMHGHWDVESDAIVDDATADSRIRAGVNVGIAIVTPASKIADILNCDAMRKMIEELEATIIAEDSPNPDTKDT